MHTLNSTSTFLLILPVLIYINNFRICLHSWGSPFVHSIKQPGLKWQNIFHYISYICSSFTAEAVFRKVYWLQMVVIFYLWLMLVPCVIVSLFHSVVYHMISATPWIFDAQNYRFENIIFLKQNKYQHYLKCVAWIRISSLTGQYQQQPLLSPHLFF